jgi:GNAT superfamily N-acetyltransferase
MLITLGNPPSDAEIDAWHAVVSAAHVRDFPAAVPEPSRAETAGKLSVPPWNGRQVHLAAAAADGGYEGVASLLLYTEEPNERAAHLPVLTVEPGARRRGVGARLWAAIRDVLVAEGRTSISTRLELGGAGEAFVDSLGFVNVLPLTRYVLRVGQALDEVPEPELPEGMRFADWSGTVPDELAEGYAAAHNAMADAPTGDLEARRPPWDVARVRAKARLVGDRGGVLFTSAVLGAEKDPDVVAYSEVVLYGPDDTRAVQGDTVVLPDYRGRGVGRAAKRHLVGALCGAHPQVREIGTSVADANTPIIAVNAALGYRRERPAGLFQMKL